MLRVQGSGFKKYYFVILLIPFVGMLIGLIYGTAMGYTSTESPTYNIVHSISVTAIVWLGCYFIVAFLWGKYSWENHPIKHLVIEVFAITVYVLLIGMGIVVLNNYFDVVPPELDTPEEFIQELLSVLLITYLITSIHEAVFFYKQWKYNFSKSTRLEKDNIEAKYETLKSQINPHFLFNSLNSLALIVDDNDEATDYIQNLSEFLRYVLKSRDRELVLVRDELQILEKYLNLQKSRFRNNLIIDIQVDEKFYHYSLPPLVLQMLVENCIKHNVISKDKPLTIKVYAEKEFVVVENNLQKKATELSTKQGLKNIVDRISFFTNKDVVIEEKTDKFKVVIPLLTVEL